MNRLFLRLLIAIASFIATSCLLLSCVNEDYDLSQGVDMDLHILRNMGIPIGNFAQISVNTLLGDTDSESSIFIIDDKGNIYLSFADDKITESFNMPEVEVDGEGGMACGDQVTVEFVPKFNGINIGGMNPIDLPASIPDKIHFSDDAEGGYIIEREFDVDFHKRLPDEVTDLKKVFLSSVIRYSFKVDKGEILHIKEGFKMTFPDFMSIEKNGDTDIYDITDEEPNVVKFLKDTKITESDPLILNIDFNAMDVPEGAVSVETDFETNKEVRYVTIDNESILAEGDLYLMPEDYKDAGLSIPQMTTLTMGVELNDLIVKSAIVKLDMDVDFETESIDIGGLPDIFNGKNINVDLHNPILKFHFKNDSPLEMNLNADIIAHCGKSEIDMHIGDETSEPVVIPADGSAEYFFSRQGEHESNKGKDIQLEELGDIISEIPDSIVIQNVHIEPKDEWIEIYQGQNCDVEMIYELYAPLAFGKDLNISFSHDIELGIGGGAMGIDSLLVSMNIVNTIPLSFEITGVALDEEGNEMKDVNVSRDFRMAAGNIDNPVKSPVNILLLGRDNTGLSKLRLNMKAETAKEYEGVIMNTSQGIALQDIKVSLPNGIVIDPTQRTTEE